MSNHPQSSTWSSHRVADYYAARLGLDRKQSQTIMANLVQTGQIEAPDDLWFLDVWRFITALRALGLAS